MKNTYVMAAVLIATSSLSTQACASVFNFDFSGSGVSGSVQLTYVPNSNTGSPLGTSPNLYDPIGSYIVTDVTGTFSSVGLNINVTNAAITGVIPRQPYHPEPDNLLAPASFSFYLVPGVTSYGTSVPGYSYDDLFYPAGSPQTASDYPAHGGYFDVYGLMFTIAGGDAVNLWSNGDKGLGVRYGAVITDGHSPGIHVSGVLVSEPRSLALFSTGLLGALAWHRRRPTVGRVAPARR